MRNEKAIDRVHRTREPYIDAVKAITIIYVSDVFGLAYYKFMYPFFVLG